MQLKTWVNDLRPPLRGQAAHYEARLEMRLHRAGLKLSEVASSQQLLRWDQETPGRGSLAPIVDPRIGGAARIDPDLIGIAAHDSAGKLAAVAALRCYDVREGLRLAIQRRTWPYGDPGLYAPGETVDVASDMPEIRAVCLGWLASLWLDTPWRSGGKAIAPVFLEALRILAMMRRPELWGFAGLIPRVPSTAWPFSPIDWKLGRGIASLYDGFHWRRPGHPRIAECSVIGITPVAEVWRRAACPVLRAELEADVNE